MANEAINGFDNEVTTLSDNSRFGLDYWNGSGFVTSQIQYENLKTEVLGDIPSKVSELELALPFKYDASNPNNYETPAQLNVRDTANRQRANHTGAQLASTISNFDSAVASSLLRPVKSWERTFGEMNAIVGMTEGDRIFCTTYGIEMIYDSYFGWTPLTMDGEGRNLGYMKFTDITGIASDPWNYAATNGGAGSTTTVPSLAPTVLFVLDTGVNTNGEYRIASGAYFVAGAGVKRCESKISVLSLSTSAERYTLMYGYLRTATVLDQSAGMYFLYDEGGVSTGSTASPNWQCVCVSGGARTFVDSGIPVTISSSGALQRARIDDNGTGGSVKFYINDVLVATITTNVPSGVPLANVLRMTKSAGTTSRLAYCDYLYIKERFNTPR